MITFSREARCSLFFFLSSLKVLHSLIRCVFSFYTLITTSSLSNSLYLLRRLIVPIFLDIKSLYLTNSSEIFSGAKSVSYFTISLYYSSFSFFLYYIFIIIIIKIYFIPLYFLHNFLLCYVFHQNIFSIYFAYF